MSKLDELRDRFAALRERLPVGSLLSRLELRTAAPGLVATAMILVGILSHSWWTGGSTGIEVSAGLRSATVCVLGTCESGPIPAKSFFSIVSAVTFFGGFIVALSLLFDTVFRQIFGLTMMPRSAGHACAGLAVASVLCLVAFPGIGQPGVSTGSGFYLTLVGSLFGIYSGYVHIFGGRMKTDGYVPVTLGPDGKPILDEGGASELSLNYCVDGVRTDGQALWSWRGGAKRMVRYLDIREIAARQLPRASPYHGRTFIDIVPIGQGSPIRVIEGATLDLYSIAIGDDEDGQPKAPTLRALIEELSTGNPKSRLDGSAKRYNGGSTADLLEGDEEIESFDSRYS